MRHLSLILFLVACNPEEADAPQGLPDDQLAVPVLTLNAPGHVVAGAINSFSASGANPGDTVYFGVSATGFGSGPCPAAAGGLCLDLRNPVLLMGTAIADDAGHASLTLTLPAASAGRFIGLQAMVVSGAGGSTSYKSDPVSDVVEPATSAAVSVEMTWGNQPVTTACDRFEYECQAQAVCEAVTETTCVYQTYDCYTGTSGSYYPRGGAGGSAFNVSVMDVMSGYGNICGCDTATFDSYGLLSFLTYCGVGKWHRAP